VPIFFHDLEEPKGKARDLPRLAFAAVRLVAAAGRRQLIVMLAMEAASAVLLGIGVLLARDVLQAVLDADKAGSGWRDVLPSLAGLAAVSVATTVASAIARRQDQMLAELVSRHAWARILDVTCSAELAAFDDAGFHDLIMRAQRGAFQAGQVVRGLLGLAQAATGVVAGLIALAVLQPLLLPVCAVAAVPSVWLARRRSRSYYGFAFRMTARDRERAYLASLLSERDAAKEIRAMDLAGFLRARHDRLYGERIEELDDLTRRQLRWALVAGVAGSGIVAATVAVLVALALGGQLSIADAAAAGGAMIVFGQRVAAGGMASQMLLESALFLEDYLTFAELAPRPEAPGEVPAPRRAEGAIAAEEVWFSYPGSERPALRGASLRIGPGEVIALVGPNGSGKTTLVEALLGNLPLAGGTRWVGPGVRIGTLDQARAGFDGENSLIDAFVARSGLSMPEARSLLAKFGLESDAVARAAGTLSPGERTRASLAQLMASGANWLVLDEPTNHLDLPAIEQLEVALDGFDGTLLLVTHDRALLDHVRLTRTIELAAGRIVRDEPR
jgi:ATP-binding cassette subfamily B protein